MSRTCASRRAGLLLGLLLLATGWAGSGCALRSDPTLESVTSDRSGITLSFERPAGLKDGPAYRATATLEEWSLSGGDAAHPVYLSLRFDELRNRPPWPARASDAAVAAYWRDSFRNPIAETVGSLTLAGQPLTVRRIRNVDGELLVVDPFVFEGRRITVSFRFDRAADTEAWLARCGRFVRSLGLRSKAGVVKWKPSSRVWSAVC